MKKYDYLIVGAGFFGAVLAERLANGLGRSVLVVEQRDHIGGNCYSAVDEETARRDFYDFLEQLRILGLIDTKEG